MRLRAVCVYVCLRVCPVVRRAEALVVLLCSGFIFAAKDQLITTGRQCVVSEKHSSTIILFVWVIHTFKKHLSVLGNQSVDLF